VGRILIEVRAARVFALLNMALHDAAVGCWRPSSSTSTRVHPRWRRRSRGSRVAFITAPTSRWARHMASASAATPVSFARTDGSDPP